MTQTADVNLVQAGILLFGGGGIGAVIIALINRWRSKEDVAAIKAATEKTTRTGEAEITKAVTVAFVDVTGSMRAEIERLQEDAVQLRERAAAHETELRAALARVIELEQRLSESAALVERLQADNDRIRGERDQAHERIVQQEGEIRQLKATIDAQTRAAQTERKS